MAVRNENVAYDLSRYEPLRKPQQPSGRPAPPPSPTGKPQIVRKPPKSAEQLWAEFVARALHSAKVIILSAIIFGLFGTLVYERAQLVELNRLESKYTDQLKEAQSRKVSLEAQFNALISIDNVEDYAKNELGMVKRQRYQTKYFVLDGEDRVVLANGESAKAQKENE